MALSQVGLSQFWRRQRLFDRPICANNAPIQSGFFKANSIRPIFKTFSLSAKCNVAIATMITVLLTVGSPPHIVRFVIAVFVGIAIYGVFWRRARAYVSQELRERIAPLIANGNATPSVAMKSVILGVGAALDYVPPNAVFGRRGCAMRSHGLAPQTAARLCAPIKQMVFVNFGTVAAFAKTNPKLSVHDSDRHQSSILLVESGCGYGIFKGHRLISLNRWLVGDVPLDAQIVAAASL